MSTTTTTPNSAVAQIGETAGLVWRTLNEQGRMSVTKLVRAVGQPRDAVLQALGWLAREDKLVIEDQGRNRFVALRAEQDGAPG
jgi:hypothetical protein